MFGFQMAKNGKIYDYECANYLWDKIKDKRWTWSEIDIEFREFHNKILSDFRKVAKNK